MYRRISGLAFSAALLAGCSGEVGPEAGPVGDPSGAAADGSESAATAEGGEVVETIQNEDGTTTVVNSDGSTTTLDSAGNVIASTPAESGGNNAAGQEIVNPDNGSQPAVVASSCEPGTPKTTQFPRLTNVQYDNTVEQLLGVRLNLGASTLQADSKGNMDARSWASYQTASELIASTILTDATARGNVISCTSEDLACAQEVIADFGAKVFRRPLEETEVATFAGLYSDTSLTETGSFDEQMAVVLEAMFQSPFFLTVAELTETESTDTNTGGTIFALNDWELASRLSYMLWDSMPDDALLTAAAAGQLTSGNGIAEQATRMIQDDRARGLIDRLHMNYMRMGPNTRWVGYSRDAGKYPAYSATQLDALASETLNVAQSVVFGNGGFAELMTTTTGFVNADTAPLYGLDPANFGADLVETDLGAGRPGILTRAGFLAANAYGNRTSPIHRGAFIMKDVLCTPMGNPSPDAASTPLPEDDGLITNRQKTDAQTSIAPDCVACHETIVNPPGFALESFDAVGGIQTTDNGVAVDTEADVLVGTRVVHVTGASDLMAAIAASPEAARCYTENWVQIAYNRVLSSEDVCTVDELGARLASPDYSVSNLITDLATIETFRFRAHEEEAAQ